MWDEIEPKDLVASSGNVTANIIHSAIYKARSDIHAIVHLHTPAALAVSCLQGGLECFDQDSANFVGDAVAYHDWEGMSDDAAESEHISVSIGSKATTLFHRNHGATCCGATVGEAWVRAFYLEKVCQLQLNHDLLHMHTGQPIIRPSPNVLNHAAAQLRGEFLAGAYEWPALLRYWKRHKDQVALPLRSSL